MAGYTVYWSADYVKKLDKAGDKGPLKVVYGSSHTVMPSISSVQAGDVLFPVTVTNGTLAVMARLKVTKTEPAFDYVMRETGRYFSSLIPEGVLYYADGKSGRYVMWAGGNGGYLSENGTVKLNVNGGEQNARLPENITRVYYESDIAEKAHLFHQEPMTCCAKTAAAGEGSEIYPRVIPIGTVRTFLFGRTEAEQKPLRFDKNGRIVAASLAGFLRKMSGDTFRTFNGLFDDR